MNYGWGIQPDQAIPAVCGIEQELVVNEKQERPLVSSTTNKTVVQPSKLFQVDDGKDRKALSAFLSQFILEKYSDSVSMPFNMGFFVLDGRIYVDEGKNLEICTPECTDPVELAARLISMRENLTDFCSQYSGYSIYCDSGSVDSSLAFHENYFTHLTMYGVESMLTPKIIPTLVSRIIITGTGGSDRSGNLVLSPRLSWMDKMDSEDSRSNRGFILLRDEPHSNQGSRLQIISSDQVMSAENIVLQMAITSSAIRLAELDRLPPTNIEWFASRDTLNLHRYGDIDYHFVFALRYQQELLATMFEYVDQCRLQGYPEFFGSEHTTDYVLGLWGKRIEDLELYCRDGDLSHINHSCEWAKKYEIIQALRARHNQPYNSQLSSKEKWVCMELNSFAPQSDMFSFHQEAFRKDVDWDLNIFTTPRAHIRAEFIGAVNEIPQRASFLKPRINWTQCGLEDNRNTTSHQLSILKLPTPFSGSRLDLDLFLEKVYGSSSPMSVTHTARIHNSSSCERTLTRRTKD